MVLGLGCDTMATMTTRILETRKERFVTTLLLALAVPCSAQLGVLLAMLARISFGAAVFWLAMMIAVAFTVGWLAAKLYGGPGSDFILELPPMRRPQLINVFVKTFARLEWYLKEVIPLFVLGTGILFLLDKLSVLDRIARIGEPLVTTWLGLPRETANAFLIGFLRRDYGAVYLLDAATGANATLSAHQVLVAMVTITFFMPCIATLFMISRELGRKTAAFITVFVFAFAFFAGGIVNHFGRLIGL
jgi:ferrous iron transport protein B